MHAVQSEELVARGREKLLQFRKSRGESTSLFSVPSPPADAVNSTSFYSDFSTTAARSPQRTALQSPPYATQLHQTTSLTSSPHATTTQQLNSSVAVPPGSPVASVAAASTSTNGVSVPHQSQSADSAPSHMHLQVQSPARENGSRTPDLDVVGELQSRLEASQKEHLSTREKLDQASAQLEGQDKEIGRLTETLERLNGELESGRIERDRLQKMCDELRGNLDSQAEVLAGVRSDNSALVAEFEQYMREHNESDKNSSIMNSSVFASQVQEQANVVDRVLRTVVSKIHAPFPELTELQRQVGTLREIVDPVGMVLGSSLGGLLGDTSTAPPTATDSSVPSSTGGRGGGGGPSLDAWSAAPSVSSVSSRQAGPVPPISAGPPRSMMQNGLPLPRITRSPSCISVASSMDPEKERILNEEVARLRTELQNQINAVQIMQKRVGEIQDEKKVLTSSLQQSLSEISSDFAAQAEELRGARIALSDEKKRTTQLSDDIVSVTNRLKERSLESKYLEQRLDAYDPSDENPQLHQEKKKVQCLLADKLFLAKQFETSQSEIDRLSEELTKLRDELGKIAKKREERRKKRVDPFSTSHIKQQRQHAANGSLMKMFAASGRPHKGSPGQPVVV